MLVELPDELPLPMPELEPVLGEVLLGEVLLGEVLDEPLELPLVPPLEDELEPDLLKCASHSEREIWPSLLVSTDEKLGCEALPEAELGELELDEVPPAEDGEEDEELLPVADGDEEEPLVDLSESAAAAANDRAKSAAAVVMVTDLIIEDSLGVEGKPPSPRKSRAASLRVSSRRATSRFLRLPRLPELPESLREQ